LARQREANLDFYVLQCSARAKVEANYRNAVECERYAQANAAQLLGEEGAEIIEEYILIHTNTPVRRRLEREAPDFIDLMEIKMGMVRMGERVRKRKAGAPQAINRHLIGGNQ